jgi:hypothetical protein
MSKRSEKMREARLIRFVGQAAAHPPPKKQKPDIEIESALGAQRAPAAPERLGVAREMTGEIDNIADDSDEDVVCLSATPPKYMRTTDDESFARTLAEEDAKMLRSRELQEAADEAIAQAYARNNVGRGEQQDRAQLAADEALARQHQQQHQIAEDEALAFRQQQQQQHYHIKSDQAVARQHGASAALSLAGQSIIDAQVEDQKACTCGMMQLCGLTTNGARQVPAQRKCA